MDICIECKINKAIIILRCGDCDNKFKERIYNQMMKSYNWPFESNYNIVLSKQQSRNDN